MPFKEFSRRQFAGIAGWSALGMSMLSARASAAIRQGRDGGANPLRLSERVLCGARRRPPIRSRAPSTRTAAARRSGTAFAHTPGTISDQQQRRHRDRSLSSLQGRHSADEGAGHQGLSLLDCLAACLPGRHRHAKSKGPRFLQPAAGRIARERHRAVCDAVPLGPAAGAAGSFRRLDLARTSKAFADYAGLCRGDASATA